MITRVRVAPVEKWCRRSKRLAMKVEGSLKNAAVGELVGLDTESMMFLNGEKVWRVVHVGGDVEIVGGKHMCEHMLEMD